jgi:hypothetical protein
MCLITWFNCRRNKILPTVNLKESSLTTLIRDYLLITSIINKDNIFTPFYNSNFANSITIEKKIRMIKPQTEMEKYMYSTYMKRRRHIKDILELYKNDYIPPADVRIEIPWWNKKIELFDENGNHLQTNYE